MHAGSYTYAASVAESDNYSAASSAAEPLTVDKADTTTLTQSLLAPYSSRSTGIYNCPGDKIRGVLALGKCDPVG